VPIIGIGHGIAPLILLIAKHHSKFPIFSTIFFLLLLASVSTLLINNLKYRIYSKIIISISILACIYGLSLSISDYFFITFCTSIPLMIFCPIWCTHAIPLQPKSN
jgi:hypothetical protein